MNIEKYNHPYDMNIEKYKEYAVLISNQTTRLHILRARLRYFLLLRRVPVQREAEYDRRRGGREAMWLRCGMSGWRG